MLPIRIILCPVDFSEPSYSALKSANELAVHFSARLILIHVVSPVPVIPTSPEPVQFNIPSYQQEMEEAATNLLQQVSKERVSSEVDCKRLIVHGDPADEIVRGAKEQETDLIVMATHGLTGWRRFMFGSVAEKVMRVSAHPVLSIRYSPEGEHG